MEVSTLSLTNLQRNALVNKTNCFLAGDLNLDQLDICKHRKLTDCFEDNAFCMLNEVSKDSITRLESGTILDISATNMLDRCFKLSIVHNKKSDHAVIYTSISGKVSNKSITCNKSKLNVAEAIRRIENVCDDHLINDAHVIN